MKYYRIILDGEDQLGGLLYAPEGIKSGYVSDGKKLPENIANLEFKLMDGSYTSFMGSDIGANLVNEDLKELIGSFITDENQIQFLPVKVSSNLYGDKMYYILYFNIIHDVINTTKTMYVEGTDQIIRLCLACNKVKGLNIFNSQPHINDLIVSDKIRKKMIKQKMDIGIEFMQINCV
jgi:hypothetical protein